MKKGASFRRLDRRISWDETNLVYNDANKSATMRIDEPKTPWAPPLPDGELLEAGGFELEPNGRHAHPSSLFAGSDFFPPPAHGRDGNGYSHRTSFESFAPEGGANGHSGAGRDAGGEADMDTDGDGGRAGASAWSCDAAGDDDGREGPESDAHHRRFEALRRAHYNEFERVVSTRTLLAHPPPDEDDEGPDANLDRSPGGYQGSQNGGRHG